MYHFFSQYSLLLFSFDYILAAYVADSLDKVSISASISLTYQSEAFEAHGEGTIAIYELDDDGTDLTFAVYPIICILL